jgi:RNA polymerase-interacting CarD/CdnL/TRCF family regulator
MAMATVNKTFRLHEDVVQYLAERVRGGDAPSQTALIEGLVRRDKKRREREEHDRQLYEEYRRAWSDPEHVAEQEQIEREFEPLDVEAWKQIDEK